MEVFSIFIEVCAKIALVLDCVVVIVFMVQLNRKGVVTCIQKQKSVYVILRVKERKSLIMEKFQKQSEWEKSRESQCMLMKHGMHGFGVTQKKNSANLKISRASF